MEKTAVEWFADRIKHGGLVSKKQFDELLEQANEKFEQQIKDAWNSAYGGDGNYEAEQYYNETFKNK